MPAEPETGHWILDYELRVKLEEKFREEPHRERMRKLLEDMVNERPRNLCSHTCKDVINSFAEMTRRMHNQLWTYRMLEELTREKVGRKTSFAHNPIRELVSSLFMFQTLYIHQMSGEQATRQETNNPIYRDFCNGMKNQSREQIRLAGDISRRITRGTSQSRTSDLLTTAANNFSHIEVQLENIENNLNKVSALTRQSK